jgi:ketosteroid isomerase-like protein
MAASSAIVRGAEFRHVKERLMKKLVKKGLPLFFVAIYALILAGCNYNNQVTSAAGVDTRADEAMIRKADSEWSNSTQAKQVATWVSYYSDDAVVMPPNAPLTTGKANITKAVGGLFAMPGLVMNWHADKVEVARLGDLAYVYGGYQLTVNGPDGKPMPDQGKYTEVWKKQSDGNWKCVVDMWSSNLPAPPTPSK